jgi:hypothetical protein
MVRNSAVTFFWAAEIYRNVWRYTERAYRYVHLDAGHVCQIFIWHVRQLTLAAVELPLLMMTN